MLTSSNSTVAQEARLIRHARLSAAEGWRIERGQNPLWREFDVWPQSESILSAKRSRICIKWVSQTLEMFFVAKSKISLTVPIDVFALGLPRMHFATYTPRAGITLQRLRIQVAQRRYMVCRYAMHWPSTSRFLMLFVRTCIITSCS